jgi:hypothetical protein
MIIVIIAVHAMAMNRKVMLTIPVTTSPMASLID